MEDGGKMNWNDAEAERSILGAQEQAGKGALEQEMDPPTTEGTAGGAGAYWLLRTGFAGLTGKEFSQVWADGRYYRYFAGDDKPAGSGFTRANSIYVNGSDVYMTGHDQCNRAIIWKNGIVQQLENDVVSQATAMFIRHNDVYVVGTRGTGNGRRPVLWKNGEAHPLSEKNGDESWVPRSVFVDLTNKGEITVTGYTIKDPYKVGHTAIFWKGILSDTIKKIEEKIVGKDAWLTGKYRFFMANDNIYIIKITDASVEFKKINEKVFRKFNIRIADNNENEEDRVKFWVYGVDLYVTATINDQAKLWKNGVEQKLETFEDPETLAGVATSAHHVYVFDDDVYVLGMRGKYKTGGVLNPETCVLWKNGKVEIEENRVSASGHLFSNEYSLVCSIFVLSSSTPEGSYAVLPLWG